MAGLNHQQNFWKYLKTPVFISSSTSWSSAHPWSPAPPITIPFTLASRGGNDTRCPAVKTITTSPFTQRSGSFFQPVLQTRITENS